jgi:polyisoprenoid-binding protein YceI
MIGSASLGRFLAGWGCAALLAGAPAAAQAVTYTIDRGHTFVYWEVLHMNTSTSRGRFDRLDGTVRFDAAQRLLEVAITVDMASVSTGFAPFDNVLRSGRLLGVAEHPSGTFVARQTIWDAAGRAPAEVRGEITLRGTTRPLTLVTRRWFCGNNPLFGREVCGGDFEATLSRSAFGISFASTMAEDLVRLQMQIEAVRGDEPEPAAGSPR